MIDTQAIRNRILELALRGQLTEQHVEDGSADDFCDHFCSRPKESSPIEQADLWFEIPQNWKWCRLSDVADFRLGKTPARGNKKYWDKGVYPWFSIADMKDKILTTSRERITQAASDECFSKGITPKGTLIMSFKLTIGRVAILGIDAFHNEAIISIFPRWDSDNTFRDYLMYVLPYSARHGRVYGAIKGNTLNKDSLSNLLIPVPPLSEQKRITDRIGQTFSVLDIIDTLQTQYANNLTVLKSKLIDMAIRGMLTKQIPEDGTAEELYQQILLEKEELVKSKKIKKEKPLAESTREEYPFEIPKSWKWVRFSDLYSLSNGVASRGTPGGSPYPVLRLADLINGRIRTDTIREIELSDDEIEGHTVQSGDLVFIRVNGSRDKVANAFLYLGEKDISYCDHLFCAHRISKQVSASYIMMAFHSAMVKAQIDPEIKTTAGQNTINQKSMAKILIPLPPFAEQNRIVSRLDEALAIIER